MCRLSLSPDSCVTMTRDIYTRWGAPSLIGAKFVPGFAAVATTLAGQFQQLAQDLARMEALLEEALEDELYFRLRGVQRATLLRAGQLPEPEAGQLLALCDSLAMGA